MDTSFYTHNTCFESCQVYTSSIRPEIRKQVICLVQIFTGMMLQGPTRISHNKLLTAFFCSILP